MAKFTLDDIRAAAEAQYGSYDIDLGDEEVRLLNPMRMSKEKRAELGRLQKRLDEIGSADEEELESVDEESVMDEMLTLVCESPAKAKKLLKALNGDLAMKVTIFNEYGKSTQAGEA